MDPVKKKKFENSLETAMNAASNRHGCSIKKTQQARTEQQAQRFHICHMALHNMFKHQRPRRKAADGKTIDWAYLSDPNITWALIDTPEGEFLFTKDGKPPEKEVFEGKYRWVAGKEPDEKASKAAMQAYLDKYKVKSMAAPGKDGCGVPCGCGGSASKHITGMACDMSGLRELGVKIAMTSPGFLDPSDAVDIFLEEFNLWRPMAKLKGKQKEEWHVEPLAGTQVALIEMHKRVKKNMDIWNQLRFSIEFVGRIGDHI